MYNEIGQDEILYEGELMKYNPGFTNQYISRYCVLTKHEFKYYKNEIMAIKHVFPLVSISIDEVVKVERVAIEIPVSSIRE